MLNCFIKKQPLGVTEISEMLGLYKSNVYDILTTLTAMEYLTQVKEAGKYELGIVRHGWAMRWVTALASTSWRAVTSTRSRRGGGDRLS